ncbi:MAG: serine/threonine-protein kinase [Deltaproteobacteria bacterium]|nr:serine/threonine-protein kinase [Deltaproteobacteria bacterium]
MSSDPDDATAPSAQARAAGPESGARWARYVLGERLGAGGMGTVFVALDPELDREVALKVLHDDDLARAGQERLRREARALARVAHPNVVPVYDVGEFAGRLYYTMERVRGRSLREWARAGRGWAEVQRVVLDAARGLAAIHAAGLVHRDVKPSNILIGDDGRARLADLGIAAGAAGPGGAEIVDTATLRAAGTLAYMAPEQLAGALGDARADQFALGVSLFELLHGKPPFGGATVDERRAAIARGPASGTSSVPGWLDAVARRAIAPDPAARFADLPALIEALAGPARRRWPYAVAAGALGAGAIVVGAMLASSSAREEPDPCAGVARELRGVWDDATRARLSAAFATTGAPYATTTWTEVARALDAYAEAWTAARAVACQASATHGASPTAERRDLCLGQRRLELTRVVALFEHPDSALVERATGAIRGLGAVDDCADPAFLDGLATATASPARAQVVEARIDLAAGRTAQALASARTAALAAHRAGDAELEAEATMVLGAAQREHGEVAPAIDTLQAALALAPAAAIRLRIELWLTLANSLARLDRLDEADATLGLAEDALRSAPDLMRETGVAISRGTLLGRRSDYAGALAQFERARALGETLWGPDSWRLAANESNLATALRRLGRTDDAIAHARRAVALVAPLGDTHPDTLSNRTGLAQALGSAGKHAEALAELQAVLAARRATLGDDHPDVARGHTAVAVELTALGRHEEAIVELRTAIAILDRVAPGSTAALTARSNLAEVLTVLERFDEALPLHRAVLAARVALYGEHHVDVALSHRNVGVCLLSMNHRQAALAELATARAIFLERLGPKHPHVTEIDQIVAHAR